MTRTFLVLVSLALGACAHRVHVREYGTVSTAAGVRASISHRHHRHLLRLAARDLQCHPGYLSTQESSPGIFSVQGCGQLREYALVCRHRWHCRWYGIQPVEQVARMETGCLGGPVEIAITGPVTRQVTACGRSVGYALVCGPAGCGWARGVAAATFVMQTDPGTNVIVVADEGTATAAPPTAEPQSDVIDLGPAGTLQSLLAVQLPALRACTQGQPVTLTMRWAADGTVSVQLAPPHAGTPMEACIQRAIGTVRIQVSGGGGEVQATL